MSEIPEVTADVLPAEPQQEQDQQTAEVQAQAVEAPVEEASVEEVPVVEAPVEEVPVVEVPVEEAPVVEAPAEPAPRQVVEKLPKQKKVRKPWPVGVRILMVFVAIILCVAMFVVSMAGTLVLNVRAIVSRDGISKIVTQLVSGETVSGPVRSALAVGTGIVYLDEYSSQSDMSGMLVDWAYDLVKEAFGNEVEISKEQVEEFVQESAVKDFVADKAAGLVEDFYNEESTTTITVEEITQLIEENKEIIEEKFDIVIDQEALEELDTKLEESGILEPIEENGLMGYIEQTMTESPAPDTAPDGEVGGSIGGTQESMNNMNKAKEIMNILRQVTSYEAVAVLGGAFVLLMVLLFFVTRRSFPATLSQTGSMLMLTGVIFCVPTVLCKVAPALVTGILGKELGGIVCLVFHAAAVVNYTVLGVGFGLIVLSIVAKVIKGMRATKALLA